MESIFGDLKNTLYFLKKVIFGYYGDSLALKVLIKDYKTLVSLVLILEIAVLIWVAV